MFCDYHVHSTFSGDGKSAMEEYLPAAAARGIKKLCFTEHIDLDVLDDRLVVDTKAYLAGFEALREKARGVQVFMGLELGYTKDTAKRVHEMTDGLPIDFKLVSRHIIGGMDPYEARYFEGKTRETALEEYLLAVYRSVRFFEDYDAVAHIGYVFKFSLDRFSPMRYLDAPDILDEILRLIIHKGKALELNTSRFQDEGMPGFDVFARYKELGGELVTLGSDAHRAADLGKAFGPAVEGLKALGFAHLASYEQRRLVMEKID